MIRFHRYFCCCLIAGAASLFATPWKTVEKLSHEEQQLQAKRERSDGTHLIEGLNSDEILSSLQEREAASQQLKLPVEVEEKTDETSWLEEERNFWEERQEWLVEMERAFHAEPSFAKREEILKKVAALVEDAKDAEKDLIEASSQELKTQVEGEATHSFTKTIETINETERLGKLFLSSYKDSRKVDPTSEFADEIAKSGTDPFASHQTSPFWRKATRSAKALVAYLAASSIFSEQTLSSVTSLKSLGALRGLESLGSLGAASFFLSRFPGAEARRDYFSPSAFSNVQNLTSSEFQHLNVIAPSLLSTLLPQSFLRSRSLTPFEKKERKRLLTSYDWGSYLNRKNDLKLQDLQPKIYSLQTNEKKPLPSLEQRRQLQQGIIFINQEFQINTDTLNDQCPTVAALVGGGFVVTWADNTPGSYKVHGQLYSASGSGASLIGSEFQINTDTLNDQCPTVAALAGGGFVVTWADNTPGSYKIHGQLYSASASGASRVGSEFQINTDTLGDYNPTVAGLTGGGFVVTWWDCCNAPYKIHAQLYSSSAVKIGSEFQVNTDTTSDYLPTVTGVTSGGFIVTWFNDTTYKLHGQLYSSSGSAIGSEFQINTDTTIDTNPTVTSLTGGSVVVTWQCGNNICGQRYSISGSGASPVGSEFQINTDTLGDKNPTVSNLKGGGFVVTWFDSTSHNIHGKLYSSSVSAIGSEFQINTDTLGDYNPTVTALSEGGFVVTWQCGNNICGQIISDVFPTSQPTTQPTTQPASQPSLQPSSQPTSQPSCQPSTQPSAQPSSQPTAQPSNQPTRVPSTQPSTQPTSQPSFQPSGSPTSQPTGQPSLQPTLQPTTQPSLQPTGQPTGQPTFQPSSQPSRQPSSQPTSRPSAQPSNQPTRLPSTQPSTQPTTQPSFQPSGSPTSQPTGQPSLQPTLQPTIQPSTQPTGGPSSQPTLIPTGFPSGKPSLIPTTQPSSFPSTQPSAFPSSQPTYQPTSQPSANPTTQPSAYPSTQPSSLPTVQPSAFPTTQPTSLPSRQPTGEPSSQPTSVPTSQPSGVPSSQPSLIPTAYPSDQPTSSPSHQPSVQPTGLPSAQPSSNPSPQPSSQPTVAPSSYPSAQPTAEPTKHPSSQPSGVPSSQPSSNPTSQPSAQPTVQPSQQPTTQPTTQPSLYPSTQPTVQPTGKPSSQPTTQPTVQPSGQPTANPTSQPSFIPTFQPSAQPTAEPTRQPSLKPSGEPSSQPSSNPSHQPSAQPTGQPSRQPAERPTSQPSAQPSGQPSIQPSRSPSSQPSSFPTLQENPLHHGWIALLGPESQSSAITSLEHQGLFLSKESDPASLFHLNTSNGALLAHYEFPWDQTQTLFSSSFYESLYALTKWNSSTPFVKASITDNNKLTGSYLLHPQVNYQTAFFHPFYNLPILLGKDTLNRSTITLANAGFSSSASFTFPLKMAAQKMASSSSAALSFFADSRTTDSGSALEAGLVNLSPIPTLKKWIQLTPAGNKTTFSSVFSNSLSVTAATLLPESQDPMIAGTINLGNLPHSYVARISSLNSLSKVSCAQLLQGCGAIQDFFTKENNLYAICNTLSQSENPSKLKLLQLDSNTCKPHSPHAQVSGPGNLACSQVTSTPTGFALACSLNQAQGLTFLTDQNLTFNNLPPRYHNSLANDLTTQPFNLTLTSLLNAPIRGTYFKPDALTGSFSIPAGDFTQLLPRDFYHAVPLPTRKPTPAPTPVPSITSSPTVKPTSSRPSIFPSSLPSLTPSISFSPTSLPSTTGPTGTHRPSHLPSSRPTRTPFSFPTSIPSAQPFGFPSAAPSKFSSFIPTFVPSPLATRISAFPSSVKTHAPTHLRRTDNPTIYNSPTSHPIYIYDPYKNFSSEMPHEEPWYRSSSFMPLYVIMGINIPFVAYTFYHICVEEAEEKSHQAEEKVNKKFKADVKELGDQYAPSASSQSSRASSPLPSGFSDISIDESELLEDFLNDPNFNQIHSNHDSSSSSSLNLSDSLSLSMDSEEIEN